MFYLSAFFSTERNLPAGFPEVKKNPELKVVEKGTTAHLDCGATGNPTPNIFWVKDARRLEPNPRFSVVQGGKSRGERDAVYNGWF